MMGPNKDEMHPDDRRNMIIFFVIAALCFFAYDAFILKPQTHAIREHQQRQAMQETIQELAETDFSESPPLSREEIVEAEISDALRIPVENNHLKGSLSLKGGRIDDIALRNFFETRENSNNVVLLSPQATDFPRYVDFGWVAEDEDKPLPDAATNWRFAQGSDQTLAPGNTVRLIWDNGDGLRFMRTFTLDENFMFSVTQKVENKSGGRVTLYPYGLVTQKGLPKDLQNAFILHEGPMGYIGDELIEESYSAIRDDRLHTYQGDNGWTGITDKYWLTSLIPPQGQDTTFRYAYTPSNVTHVEGRYQADFTGAGLTLESGQSGEFTSHVFVGAKKVLLLEKYGAELNIPNFDLAVDFGMFWFMTKPFFYALHYFGEYTGNMGVAIILLTILIRTAVFPLTNTSYRSFAKLKKVSPQMMELREKYGDDKSKLQQELVSLYQKEGVNPMSGCLPIIIQIPIFFSLYKVLFVTIEMRHAPFFGWIQDLSAPDPTSIFNLFGLIAWDVPSFLQIGVWPCVMLVAMYIQKKLNPPPQDPIQRDMANYFPFIMTYIMSRFASGLVIYWTFSAIIGVIQQIIIMRSLNVPIYLFGQSEEEKKLEQAVEKGPGVHPMAEMIEDEFEDGMFGDHQEGDQKQEQKPKKKISPPKPKKKKKKK